MESVTKAFFEGVVIGGVLSSLIYFGFITLYFVLFEKVKENKNGREKGKHRCIR